MNRHNLDDKVAESDNYKFLSSHLTSNSQHDPRRWGFVTNIFHRPVSSCVAGEKFDEEREKKKKTWKADNLNTFRWIPQ